MKSSVTDKTTKPRTTHIPAAGDIVWLELDPATGHEQGGRRPCLVLSEQQLAIQTGYAIVCPITSRIRGLHFEVPLSNTKTSGVVLTHQVRSIDLSARFAKFIEPATPGVLQQCRDYTQVLIGSAQSGH